MSSSAPASASDSFTHRYRFVDWATQVYVVLVGLLIAIAHTPRMPTWPYVVAAHAVGAAGVHFLIRAAGRAGASGPVRFLREFYPILGYTLLYNETGYVNHLLAMPPLDPWLIRQEHALFGCQPSVEFLSRVPNTVFSEVMHAAYFSYYLMIAGVGGWLWWSNRPAFRHFVGVISFVFYACYAAYLFVPAVGPRRFFEASTERELFIQLYAREPASVPETLQHGPFFSIMRLIYEYLETWGAAFPSSHVAVALATLWFTWRYLPQLRWVHSTAVVLLCLSVVYGRFHYVLDAMAGMLACAVLLPLGNGLHRWFNRTAAEA